MQTYIDNILKANANVGVNSLTTHDAELQHWGVLGMHWGVRKDKSLKLTKQQKREVKAQKYISKAAAFQAKINKVKVQSGLTIYQKRGAIKEYAEYRDRALSDAEKKRQGKLSSNQKKLLIGAAVVGTIVAAKLTYDGIQSGDFHRISEKGKAFVNGKNAIDFAKNPSFADKSITPDQVLEKVVHGINPDYGAIGTKMNCRRATFAYEMRRRGYDVMATKTTNGRGQTAPGLLNALSPGKKAEPTGAFGHIKRMIQESLTKESGGDQSLTTMTEAFSAGGKSKIDVGTGRNAALSIFQALSKQPNGSRGELGVMWGSGGGHSLAYEIFNGKPVIIDNQTGTIFETVNSMIYNLPDVASAGFTRLDDAPLNLDYLLRWVKNAV